MARRTLASLAALLLALAATFAVASASFACHPCACQLINNELRADCGGENITDIPRTLPDNVTTLRLYETRMPVLRRDALTKYRQLTHLIIHGDEALREVQSGAFDNNAELSALYITLCTNLTRIEAGVFTRFHRLRFINLERNGLVELPDFSAFTNLENTSAFVDLDYNKITKIRSRAWCRPRAGAEGGGCSAVTYAVLSIRENLLVEIEAYAFAGAKILALDVSINSKLTNIDVNAFSGCLSLHNLSLSGTAITKLPVVGLEELLVLNLEGIPTLTMLPPTVSYIKMENVRVSYPQHCCAFKYPKIQDGLVYEQVKQKQEAHRCPVIKSSTAAPKSIESGEQATDDTSTDFTGYWNPGRDFPFRRLLGMSAHLGSFGSIINEDQWGAINTQKPGGAERTPESPGNWLPSGVTPSSSQDKQRTADPCSDEGWNLDLWRELHLNCTPEPNAFNPCVDVLEADWLRALLWLVALLTLAGNASVLAFTACTRGTTAAPLTVGKFLVANLAVADLALVSHLMALAAEDAATRGEYFNHALSWQQGGWCDAMGFVAVFGAELSVFTLCAITLERWYAISHAINLTKRMRMRHAVVIMAAGWAVCVAIAAAPLFDVSSYRVTSMCLPFRYDTVVDKAYIIFLLVVNVGAFVLVLCCYVSMFLQVRGSDAWSSGDAYIAKRMALLVFTDFICWGPVAIVAALSAGGIDVSLSSFSLSQLTHAKIVLAIFYPFNACANPFLYALLTKQFRKDMVTAMGRFGLCRWKLRYVVESLTTSHSSSPWHLPGSRGSRRGRGTATHPSAGSLNTQCTLAGAACPHQPCPHAVGRPHIGGTDDASIESPGPDSNNRSADWFIPPHVCSELVAVHSLCPRHQLGTGDCSGLQHFPPPASVTRTQASGQQQQHPLLEARLSGGRFQSEHHPLLETRLSSGRSHAAPCYTGAAIGQATRRDSQRRRGDCSFVVEACHPSNLVEAAAEAIQRARDQTQSLLPPASAVTNSRETRAPDDRSRADTEFRSDAVPTASSNSRSDQAALCSAPGQTVSVHVPSTEHVQEFGHCRQQWTRLPAGPGTSRGAEITTDSLMAGPQGGSATSSVTPAKEGSNATSARDESEAPAVIERKLSASGQARSNRESGFYSLERPLTNENSPLLGRTCEDTFTVLPQQGGSSSSSASAAEATRRMSSSSTES